MTGNSQSRLSGTKKTLILNLISLGLLGVTTVFVQAAYLAESRSSNGISLNRLLRIDASTTIAVVQASQTVLIALITVTLGEVFEFIQWTAAASKGRGLRYLTFLAMSPTTGYLGTLKLVFARHLSCVSLDTRLWGLMKVLLTGGVWLSGIVLFINTSSITVYDTGFSYKVTGGIGPFSGSLVQPFLEFLQSLAPPDQKNQTIVPYTYSSVVNMLVMNSLVSTVASPVSCTDDGYGDCTSYLVTGGLEIVTPWIPPAEDNGEFTLARVNRVPSIQVDVSTLDTKESSFSDKDCDVFGKEGIIIGLKLCIAVDPKSLGSLRTGLFVCTNGTDNKTCHARDSEPFLPNITAQITFYTSQATIIASRSNYSIISVIDQTTPVPYPGFHTPTSTNSSTSINTTTPEQELQAYRTALHWLLDFSSSNIPPPSSLVELFWTASLQLSSPSTSTGILSQNLHSLLVFPFFLFNANNWGNLQTKQNETVEGLPQEFYTTASLVQGYDKVKFDSGMFILFLGLQGVAVVFVWGVLVWVWFGGKGGGKGRLPDISEFPLYDGAFKTRIVKRHGSDSDMASLANDGASTSEIIRDMKKYRVLLK